MKTNEIKCCTPNGQIKRYKDCIGCDRNPLELNQNKMTAVEWFAKQVLRSRQLGFISNEKFNELLEQAKEMEKEQKGYSEEDVIEMLFMALNEPEQECCITHTKDSIVRKVLKTFKSE